jgi:hypothetical protein
MFNEICVYEAKLTKLDEIEELMNEVAELYTCTMSMNY